MSPHEEQSLLYSVKILKLNERPIWLIFYLLFKPESLRNWYIVIAFGNNNSPRFTDCRKSCLQAGTWQLEPYAYCYFSCLIQSEVMRALITFLIRLD
jgi:hypothetical protein